MEKLSNIIIKQIKETGPLTFRDFMESALYHSRFGYYNRTVEIGKGGDFYTAANVSELFGRQLAKVIMSAQAEPAIDGPVVIVEFGAGSGLLASDILTELTNNSKISDIEYIIVEKSEKFIQRQKGKLKEFSDIVKWMSLDELISTPVSGVIIMNEVIDAFAVHRVTLRNGKLQEIYLDYQDDFREVNGPLSTPKLYDYLDKYGVPFSEGQEGEINLAALEWLESMAKLLLRGYLVIIDYGAKAEELYSDRRFTGTLVCYHQHRLINNPYQRIGEQDITAHVNFTALINRGLELGFKLVSLQSQANFLISRGIMDDLDELNRSDVPRTEKLKAAMAVKRLIMPSGMGERFQVLIEGKGVHFD